MKKFKFCHHLFTHPCFCYQFWSSLTIIQTKNTKTFLKISYFMFHRTKKESSKKQIQICLHPINNWWTESSPCTTFVFFFFDKPLQSHASHNLRGKNLTRLQLTTLMCMCIIWNGLKNTIYDAILFLLCIYSLEDAFIQSNLQYLACYCNIGLFKMIHYKLYLLVYYQSINW